MRLGKLNRRVVIEQAVAGSPQQLPSGQPDFVWATYATVWASIEPLRGNERITAQALGSEIDVRIRCRYVAGVTAAMRVNFSGTYYNILAVIDPETRHRELQIMCKTGLNDGQ